jgi:sterol 3beta-glucosyltransferase
VFVGFGSHGHGEAERAGETVAAAVRQARVRAVVQTGWAGLTVSGDDVLPIASVPHDWLFPRMAAVVHHAGAGTNGAGLRAGVPVVPVPVVADQPFWSARLAWVGVSLGAVRFKHLSAERWRRSSGRRWASRPTGSVPKYCRMEVRAGWSCCAGETLMVVQSA